MLNSVVKALFFWLIISFYTKDNEITFDVSMMIRLTYGKLQGGHF